MKKLSKILAAVMCAAVVLGTIMIPTKALAAEPTTYVVRYGSEWAFYADNCWMSINSLDSYVKAGDKIAVEYTDTTPSTPVIITLSKKISEFAVAGNTCGILYGDVDYAYAVTGGTVIVNGNVGKVSYFAGSTVQINGNVGEFVASYSDGAAVAFAVTGTVDHFVGHVSDYKNSPAEVYDIPAGKCHSGNEGYVWLDTEYLHTTSTKTATAATPAKTTAKELDEVPKTGLTTTGTAICFAMGAICALGAVLVAGKKKQEF